MGDPKKTVKQYRTPNKPWDKDRIVEEKKIVDTYALKNKKELWRVQTILRNKRINARALLALPLEVRVKKEKELLDSLKALGILRGKPSLEDVLTLEITSFLERRLSVIVWRKGLANTAKQARQIVVHGHIGVNGKKVNVPSYLVKVDEESSVAYFGKPLKLEHENAKVIDKKKKDFEEVKGNDVIENTDSIENDVVEKQEVKE